MTNMGQLFVWLHHRQQCFNSDTRFREFTNTIGIQPKNMAYPRQWSNFGPWKGIDIEYVSCCCRDQPIVTTDKFIGFLVQRIEGKSTLWSVSIGNHGETMAFPYQMSGGEVPFLHKNRSSFFPWSQSIEANQLANLTERFQLLLIPVLLLAPETSWNHVPLHQQHQDPANSSTCFAWRNMPDLTIISGLLSLDIIISTYQNYFGWLRNPTPVGNYWSTYVNTVYSMGSYDVYYDVCPTNWWFPNHPQYYPTPCSTQACMRISLCPQEPGIHESSPGRLSRPWSYHVIPLILIGSMRLVPSWIPIFDGISMYFRGKKTCVHSHLKNDFGCMYI